MHPQRWIIERSNGLFTLRPKQAAASWRLTSYDRGTEGALRYGRSWSMNKMQDEWLIETLSHGFVRLQSRYTGNYLMDRDGSRPQAREFRDWTRFKWTLELKVAY